MNLTRHRALLPVILLSAIPLLMGAVASPAYTSERTVPLPGGSSARLTLVEMGGCQYVVLCGPSTQSGNAITHHAACSNAVHSRHSD